MTENKPYLLLAEDDPDDREFFADAFGKKNPAIGLKFVANGHEALQFMRNCTPEELPTVLLIDYQMPGLDGLGLLQTMHDQSDYQQIIKIMWSTSRRVKDIEDCKRFGASHYLIKPSTDAELDVIIKQLSAVFELTHGKNSFISR